jgi:hypothetical protein
MGPALVVGQVVVENALGMFLVFDGTDHAETRACDQFKRGVIGDSRA